MNSLVTEDMIRRMCTTMRHRGPDDEGIYIKKNIYCVALGHRRLSIIDLSSSGHQPMANEDESIWLVLNGEIYNYKELRVELEAKGHRFKSLSDTETAIHLYEEHGENFIQYLRGMFALAIWDNQNEVLILARDRVGKKPLLYYQQNNIFAFASEFNSLLASGVVKKDINRKAIDYYLTFGYIPAPLSIYKDIFKLQPGHMLVLGKNGAEIKRYWQLNYTPKLRIPEEEASQEVLRLLKEAIKIRLYSDVPLGAFLSGGIDSSMVVALMSQYSNKKVKTFSVGFEEKDYSELAYAKKVSDRYNTEHHEFIVRPNTLSILPTLVEHYGEPYADSSCVPSYYVAQQTKQYVTVALNGDGGDELFAGYERYRAMLLVEFYRRFPPLVKRSIYTLASLLPDSINSKNKLRQIKRFFATINFSYQERYVRWVGIFNEDMRKEIYSQDYSKEVSLRDYLKFVEPFFNTAGGTGLLDSLLNVDTNTYLPGDLLAKMDIVTMANSLEARSPFLDHKLMEFVARLPQKYKIRHLVKKYILKKIAADYIPRENIVRKKMGFGLPVCEWFRGDLKDYLSDTLLSKKCLKRGYFKPEVIREIVHAHVNYKKDYTYQLWALLMLELWHNRFID